MPLTTGPSRPQDGRSTNEDAYSLGRSPVPHALLCDGPGAASRAAARAVKLFLTLFNQAPMTDLGQFQTWIHWAHLPDSALLGGPQSTFLALACLGSRVLGACAGDSRLYLLPREGGPRILTEGAAKDRLGSGRVTPFPIHQQVGSGDVLLLMSDGAWTPLNLARLRAIRSKSPSRHISEFPLMLLDEAGRSGRADDMTVVALAIP
ncbi:hypothetical protein GETHOR_08270 [Geothrix oryzae]|uniref:PPM-type phosphatase domain-containing protein n=1 Tax=Geothrix oryzae TaxID=2927975 RepID=A0ABM8DP45_9BACT|nr:PP2C family serine/threonine-protein phosphatase [Geothrix oryzae]BDU68726.1 hypothetical protein GETHOR_08270 [Geothrix oryzae]